MVHSAEVVLPSDVCLDTPRIQAYEEDEADTTLEDESDLLEEARNTALARTAVYQQDLRNYHSRRLRTRSFEVGDLVLRLKEKSASETCSHSTYGSITLFDWNIYA